jgi:hypothetical protein
VTLKADPPARAEAPAFTVFPFVMLIWLSENDEEEIEAPLAAAPAKFTVPKLASFTGVQFDPLQTEGASAIHSADDSAADEAVCGGGENDQPLLTSLMVRVNVDPELVTCAAMVSPPDTGNCVVDKLFEGCGDAAWNISHHA